jgi:hypothetical protein
MIPVERLQLPERVIVQPFGDPDAPLYRATVQRPITCCPEGHPSAKEAADCLGDAVKTLARRQAP